MFLSSSPVTSNAWFYITHSLLAKLSPGAEFKDISHQIQQDSSPLLVTVKSVRPEVAVCSSPCQRTVLRAVFATVMLTEARVPVVALCIRWILGPFMGHSNAAVVLSRGQLCAPVAKITYRSGQRHSKGKIPSLP